MNTMTTEPETQLADAMVKAADDIRDLTSALVLSSTLGATLDVDMDGLEELLEELRLLISIQNDSQSRAAVLGTLIGNSLDALLMQAALHLAVQDA